MRIGLSFSMFVLLLNQVALAYRTASEIRHLQDKNDIIHITEDNYESFAYGQREYYSVLLLTTSRTNKQGQTCELCNSFFTIWHKLVKTFTRTLNELEEPSVVFFEAEVLETPTLVKDFAVKAVPQLVIYAPNVVDDNYTWKASGFYSYPLNSQNAEDIMAVADFLAKLLGIHVDVAEDFSVNNFMKFFCIFFFLFMGFKKLLLPVIADKGKFFSGLLSILTIMISVTGYKFTQINGIPFIAKNSEDQIMYFAGSPGWQFGIEIFTVTLMYLGMGAFVLILIWLMKSNNISQSKRNILAFFGNFILFYLFSYFLSCYKIKFGEYPYTI